MLYMTKSDYEKILAHCKEGLPNESCGLIGGVREGDKKYIRKVYTIGLLLFSCTSLACALSDSLFTLIIARTLQGFGAAAIASVNTALIRIIYPKRFLGRGMGINALVVSVSAAAGQIGRAHV